MEEPLTPSKPMPQRISVSSSAFLFIISLSLFSFSLCFLSFKDTTFWFFLFNAIIFFIAAVDSDASSSSKHRPDLYEEYLKTTRSRNTHLVPITESRAEEKKDSECRGEDPVSESSTTTEEKKDSYTESSCDEDSSEKSGVERVDGKRFLRSESEKAIVAVDSDKKKGSLSRSETENGRPRSDDGDFSALSNEELNKRVEEFIRRFNREIWLQEMRERNKNQEK